MVLPKLSFICYLYYGYSASMAPDHIRLDATDGIATSAANSARVRAKVRASLLLLGHIENTLE